MCYIYSFYSQNPRQSVLGWFERFRGNLLGKLEKVAGMESGFFAGFYLDATGTDKTVGPPGPVLPREWNS